MESDPPLPTGGLFVDEHRRKASKSSIVFWVIAVGLLVTLGVALSRSHTASFGRTPVHSTVIRSVAYNADTCVLEIEFTSQEVYQYFDVPPEVATGLMSADSKGQYFVSVIKSGGYHFRHIATTPAVTNAPIPVVAAVSLDGHWKSTSHDVFSITETATGMDIQVVRSPQLLRGWGQLSRTGQRWSGQFHAVFADDPAVGLRRCHLEIVAKDANALTVMSDAIRWDDSGNETSRRRISFQLQRE